MQDWKIGYSLSDKTFFLDDNIIKTNAKRLKDNTEVCLLKIHQNDNTYEQTSSYYFSILEQIQKQKHNNIVNVLDIYKDKSNYSYIVMENCSKNLLHYFQIHSQGFNTEQIFLFMKQITKGYQWLIEQGVLHRNLRPENIYYIEDNNKDILFKIGGFEHSKLLKLFDGGEPIDENTKKPSQDYYQAPEQSNYNYSFNADIFSFGLILLQMITKQKLQNLKEELKQKNLKDICKLDNIDDRIKELLGEMIVYDAQKRLTWSLLIMKLFYQKIEKIQYHETAISLENKSKCFIKIINKHIRDYAYYLKINAKQELQINKLLRGKDNPNIVKVYEILHEPESQSIYIIMEKCDGSLKNLLDNKQFVVNVQNILDLVRQINNGYQFLEQNSIIHRDIKPENILYQKDDNKIQYKIADFGISRLTKEGCSKCGTLCYTAPEVNGNCSYSNKCDIYSLGILIYYVATGQQYPFEGNQFKQFFELLKVKKSIEHCYPNNLVLDEKIKFLINKMIVYEAKDRISWGKQMNELIQSIQPQQQLNNEFDQKQKPQISQIQNQPFSQQFNIFNPILAKNQTTQQFQNLKICSQKPINSQIAQFQPRNNLTNQNTKSFSIQPRPHEQTTTNTNQTKFQNLNFNAQTNFGQQQFFQQPNQNKQINSKIISFPNKNVSFIPQQVNQKIFHFQTEPKQNFKKD